MSDNVNFTNNLHINLLTVSNNIMCFLLPYTCIHNWVTTCELRFDAKFDASLYNFQVNAINSYIFTVGLSIITCQLNLSTESFSK